MGEAQGVGPHARPTDAPDERHVVSAYRCLSLRRLRLLVQQRDTRGSICLLHAQCRRLQLLSNNRRAVQTRLAWPWAPQALWSSPKTVKQRFKFGVPHCMLCRDKNTVLTPQTHKMHKMDAWCHPGGKMNLAPTHDRSMQVRVSSAAQAHHPN